MLIDETYFIGEINIPNTDKPDVKENLQVFIEKYEPIFLRQLLGSFYDVFQSGVTNESNAEQRFKDILYGKSFTYQGKAFYWRGLKVETLDPVPNPAPLFKWSMIANYVYWYWMTDKLSVTVQVGEASSKAENATRVTPQHKMIRAWNENYRQVCVFFQFMEANRNVYPEWNTDHQPEALLHFYRVNQFGI